MSLSLVSSLGVEKLGLGGSEFFGRQHALVGQALELRQLVGDVGRAAAGRCRHGSLGVLLRLQVLEPRFLILLAVAGTLCMFSDRIGRTAYHRGPHQRTSSS